MDDAERHVVVRLVVAKTGEPQGFELRAGERTLPLTFVEAEELATSVADELRRLLQVARGMRDQEP
jgi:hypothetical protein